MQSQQLQYDEINKKIPLVVIDPEGKFKYILVKVTLNDDKTWYIVRGYKALDYHAENFQALQEEVQKCGIKWNSQFKYDGDSSFTGYSDKDIIIFQCLGGGRVIHSSSKQIFSVFGYSQAFGQADHKITLQLLKNYTQYPECNYKVSFEGY